jgi:hypothetical protein
MTKNTLSPTPNESRPPLLDKRHRRFLLIVPAIVLPFFCWIFYSLHGNGDSKTGMGSRLNQFLGLNTELPGPRINPKTSPKNKMDYYLKAQQDSARRKEWLRQDPYRNPSNISAPPAAGMLPRESEGAKMENIMEKGEGQVSELLTRINQLKQKMKQPASLPRFAQPVRPSVPYPELSRLKDLVQNGHTLPAAPAADTELDKLNQLVDKIMRLQPQAGAKPADEVPTDANLTGRGRGQTAARTIELLPADLGRGNAIPAEVAEDETLVSGATVALRLPEGASLGGTSVPKGQLIYGESKVGGNRLLIHISNIRIGHSIYPLSLQVYDLDGLPGIRIPGMQTREIAKESAGQGISSLTLENYDPSLAGQAAGVGVQAAKTLLSRKVRVEKAYVRVGYQVLLGSSNLFTRFNSILFTPQDTVHAQPPGFAPGGFLLSACRQGGITFSLNGVFVQRDTFWIALGIENHSPIDFMPESLKWSIRDRKRFKRTAVQDLELTPLYCSSFEQIACDSTTTLWVAFAPFYPGKGQFVEAELSERRAGRVLHMVMSETYFRGIKKLPE